MGRELQKFWGDESGQDFIEYVAVSLIVLIAVVALIVTYATELAQAFQTLADFVTSIYTTGQGPQ